MSLQSHYDVMIIGGGPAGSTSALYHHRLGLKTLLIDKAFFPRDKVCGDGIPSKVIRLLKDMHIPSADIKALGFGINCMDIYSPAGDFVSYQSEGINEETKSICMPRLVFDNLLFQQVKRENPHVCDGMILKSITRDSREFIVHIEDRRLGIHHEVRSALIIGADGANSPTRKFLGLKTGDDRFRFNGIRTYAEGDFEPVIKIFYDRICLPGYFWIFPVSARQANIGLMVDKATCRKQNLNIMQMFYFLLENNKDIQTALRGITLQDKPQGHPLPLGHPGIETVTAGAMLIGDAASLINPITGGGIYYAMVSGVKAAHVSRRAVESKRFSENDLREYQSYFTHSLLPGFNAANRMRRYFTAAKNVEHLVARCRKHKFYRNLFISLYGRPLGRYFFINPFYWYKLIKS